MALLADSTKCMRLYCLLACAPSIMANSTPAGHGAVKKLALQSSENSAAAHLRQCSRSVEVRVSAVPHRRCQPAHQHAPAQAAWQHQSSTAPCLRCCRMLLEPGPLRYCYQAYVWNTTHLPRLAEHVARGVHQLHTIVPCGIVGCCDADTRCLGQLHAASGHEEAASAPDPGFLGSGL